MSFFPDAKRYDDAQFRRCGRRGSCCRRFARTVAELRRRRCFRTGREVIRRAFDRGVTHFDLANNYGPPYGSAEENFGEILRKDFRGHRNELLISSKPVGIRGPGPTASVVRGIFARSLTKAFNAWDSTTSISSIRTALAQLPLEETMGALVQAVHQCKALYVGIVLQPRADTRAAQILKSAGRSIC